MAWVNENLPVCLKSRQPCEPLRISNGPLARDGSYPAGPMSALLSANEIRLTYGYQTLLDVAL